MKSPGGTVENEVYTSRGRYTRTHTQIYDFIFSVSVDPHGSVATCPCVVRTADRPLTALWLLLFLLRRSLSLAKRRAAQEVPTSSSITESGPARVRGLCPNFTRGEQKGSVFVSAQACAACVYTPPRHF